MSRTEIIQKILDTKLVAIVRLSEQNLVEPTLENLVSAGVSVLEVTTNTPGFEAEISKARKRFPKVLIGAGTVTTAQLAIKAIQSNAQFLVTPNTQVDVIRIAHEHDIPALIGALTPTEIAKALDHGADIIKLFPAGIMGTDYFRAIRGPYNSGRFFAVGGINQANIQDWFKAGVSGVGVGGSLINKNAEETKKEAEKLLKLIKEV